MGARLKILIRLLDCMVVNNKGFTLIELIISILIVSIIASISIPGIISYQNKQIEDNFVNQYVNQLRNLQNVSLTKDRITKVYYDTAGFVNFCENEADTVCKTLKVPSLITQNQVSTTTFLNFYFDKYGNLLSFPNKEMYTSDTPEDDLKVNFPSYQVILNAFGGIIKNTNAADSVNTQE